MGRYIIILRLQRAKEGCIAGPQKYLVCGYFLTSSAIFVEKSKAA